MLSAPRGSFVQKVRFSIRTEESGLGFRGASRFGRVTSGTRRGALETVKAVWKITLGASRNIGFKNSFSLNRMFGACGCPAREGGRIDMRNGAPASR
jgi:hypothetical protein